MTQLNPIPLREDVLNAFAVEPDHGRKTLERYLNDYPQFGPDIIDLSRELSRVVIGTDGPLPSRDQGLIEAAWQKHFADTPHAVSDPLASLSVEELRDAARQLDVPRQVITAFRERRVLIDSVPSRFLETLAAVLKTSFIQLKLVLSLQPSPILGRSYKADGKPGDNTQVTFERILVDAGVSDEKIMSLLSSH